MARPATGGSGIPTQSNLRHAFETRAEQTGGVIEGVGQGAIEGVEIGILNSDGTADSPDLV
jgi:hypothetical protein